MPRLLFVLFVAKSTQALERLSPASQELLHHPLKTPAEDRESQGDRSLLGGQWFIEAVTREAALRLEGRRVDLSTCLRPPHHPLLIGYLSLRD